MIRFLSSCILACGLLTAACDQTPAGTTAAQSAPTAFASDRLEFEIVGTGPDVILIPGLASNRAVWDAVTENMAQDYTLHVVQVSGFGGAPARGNAGQTQVLDGLAEDIAAYTATLDTPPAVIGHSLGGLLALKVGRHAEAEVDRLMVIDVLPFFSVLIDPEATPASINPVATLAKITLIGQTDEQFASGQRTALSGLVKDQTGLDKALSWSVASDRNVMAQAMYEVMVLDMRDEIALLDAPLTALFARDPSLPNMAAVEALYRNLYAPAPNGKVVAVDGAYHFIMFDQEQAFLEEIERFLSAN